MDYFFDTQKCIDRLYDEYQKHKKLIIACDFDDTIFDFHGRGSSHEEVIQLLKECNALGFYVVLFSASKPERYPMMMEFTKNLGVEVACINKNVVELKYGNNGKIYYNILLDDRAGLFQAVTTLRAVIEKIKATVK
jgi:hydroxymethylpyrimidine pyrophosphatase-like HAD family hydrolase